MVRSGPPVPLPCLLPQTLSSDSQFSFFFSDFGWSRPELSPAAPVVGAAFRAKRRRAPPETARQVRSVRRLRFRDRRLEFMFEWNLLPCRFSRPVQLRFLLQFH